MSNDPTHDATPDPRDDRHATRERVLRARIVRYDTAPDELTLYPADVTDGRRATTWISAQEGSFVALEDRR